VEDQSTDQKIVGATIESDHDHAVTDESGYFTIRVSKGSGILRIRSVGYDLLEMNIRHQSPPDSCVNIKLRQTVVKLQEVVINNFLTRGININSDGAIQIKASSLGVLPGLMDPDILQTVQALPGIQSVDERVSDINVRGGTHDQNLIFWDGIRMYQSGHFFGLISAFNPYLTDQVKLVKNGTSAALGEGVSSTIDIRTNDEVTQKFSGGAGVNMLNADLFIKVPISKKFALHVSGRRSISDLLKTPTYKSYFDRVFRNTDVLNAYENTLDTLLESDENFHFYDVSVKALYDITRNDKLRISFLNVSNKIDYKEGAIINNELQSNTSSLTQNSLGTGLKYSKIWKDQVHSSVQVYFSKYDLEAINFDIRNDQRLYQENEVKDAGIKLDARFIINRNFDLYTGYQFTESGISNLVDINNPVYRRHIKKVLRTNTVFGEGYFVSNSGNTNLKLGLRISHFDKFNLVRAEPRLTFSQNLLESFTFELLGEMKSQSSVQIIDLPNDFLGVEKRRWIMSNQDDIPIVTSRQLSIGLRYHPGKLLISLEPFYKQVDGITSSSQGFQNQFQFVRSSGSYTAIGYDFLINYQHARFNTWVSASFADNEYNFPEFSPSIFPNNIDIRHAMTLGIAYQSNKIHFSTGLNWRTGKPYTKAVGVEQNNIIYESPNSSNLSDYLRLDISAIYKFNLSEAVRGEIGASIWNLTNDQNIVNTYYQLDNRLNIEEIQQYALGFTPNFMFRISF